MTSSLLDTLLSRFEWSRRGAPSLRCAETARGVSPEQSKWHQAFSSRARPKSGGLHEANCAELVDNVAGRTLPLVMRPSRATIFNTATGEGQTCWCRRAF